MSLIRKFTSPFNLIVTNNTKNLSNSFQTQTSFKRTPYSQSRSIWWIYIFCLVYTYSSFSSLKPCNTQNGQHINNSVSQMLRTRRFSTLFYYLDKLPKITLEFIIELINMNYPFNIPFKLSLKTTRKLLNSMMVYSVRNFANI